MESIAKHCTDLKNKYEECFNKWYAGKFLKGQGSETPCQELFEDYKACLMVTIKEKQLDRLIQESKSTPSPSQKASSQTSSSS